MDLQVIMGAAGGVLIAGLLLWQAVRMMRTQRGPSAVSDQWLADQKTRLDW